MLMINIRFSRHAEERIKNRLNNLVSKDEIATAVSKKFYQHGRTYLQIKKIEYTEIPDPSVTPDGIARGDTVVAALDFDKRTNVCHVTTVILRKSWSKSDIYTKTVS
jgi:hypothetical protein